MYVRVGSSGQDPAGLCFVLVFVVVGKACIFLLGRPVAFACALIGPL